jgi:hypothetical protein
MKSGQRDRRQWHCRMEAITTTSNMPMSANKPRIRFSVLQMQYSLLHTLMVFFQRTSARYSQRNFNGNQPASVKSTEADMLVAATFSGHIDE